MRCRASDDILLACPPDVVWRALTDLHTWPIWWPHSTEVSVKRHVVGLVGSRVAIKPRFGLSFVCEVRTQQAGESLRFEYVEGAFAGFGDWRLSAEGAGTRLSYSVDLGFRSRLARVLALLIDVSPLHSRLMRDIYAGLARHLARQPLSA